MKKFILVICLLLLFGCVKPKETTKFLQEPGILDAYEKIIIDKGLELYGVELIPNANAFSYVYDSALPTIFYSKDKIDVPVKTTVEPVYSFTVRIHLRSDRFNEKSTYDVLDDGFIMNGITSGISNYLKEAFLAVHKKSLLDLQQFDSNINVSVRWVNSKVAELTYDQEEERLKLYRWMFTHYNNGDFMDETKYMELLDAFILKNNASKKVPAYINVKIKHDANATISHEAQVDRVIEFIKTHPTLPDAHYEVQMSSHEDQPFIRKSLKVPSQKES